MGFRSRKSVKAGPLRFTASKSGVSASFGVKGARITKTASGRTRTTLSVPGTGLSYVTETGGKMRHEKKKAAPEPAPRSADLPDGTPQPTTPLSARFIRTMGIILAVFGLAFCTPLFPLGVVAVVAGVYFAVKARAIADRHNKKIPCCGGGGRP